MVCPTCRREECVQKAEYVDTRNHTGRRVWVVRIFWSKCGRFVSDTVDPNTVEVGDSPEPTYNWAEVVASGLGIRRGKGVTHEV